MRWLPQVTARWASEPVSGNHRQQLCAHVGAVPINAVDEFTVAFQPVELEPHQRRALSRDHHVAETTASRIRPCPSCSPSHMPSHTS